MLMKKSLMLSEISNAKDNKNADFDSHRDGAIKSMVMFGGSQLLNPVKRGTGADHPQGSIVLNPKQLSSDFAGGEENDSQISLDFFVQKEKRAKKSSQQSKNSARSR